MLLLSSFPRFLSLPYSTVTLSAPRKRCRFSLSASAVTNANTKRAILWYKQDLRVDDHPGLVECATCHSLVPLYVFDRRILSRYSSEMLELVLYALEDLRRSLQEQGSNLVVRFGNSEDVIRDLLQEVKAVRVLAEEEVENHLRAVIYSVDDTLVRDGYPSLVLWRTPFYQLKNLEDMPFCYEEFKKLKLPVSSPITSPALPYPEIEIEWGSLPTLDELKRFVDEDPFRLEEIYASMKQMSAKTILQNRQSKLRKGNIEILSSEPIQSKRKDSSVFVTQGRDVVGGGTNNVLNALNAYLRYLEGTARDDWQEVHEKLRNAESRDGASFFTLFGPALCLGIISRRTVYHEAIKYEKERNAGFLSPFGYSTTTIAAAADAACSLEWYWLMALKCLSTNDGPYSVRIWRWNGYLIQYTVAGTEGPAVLLVHGFGAFLNHYRHNILNISEAGNRVWAITLLGFGKSEKPNVVYTELMWAELLRDFVIEVVGEPVHLVGNSIGGYFVAIMANFWCSLVKSVVLINSAGDVIPGYSYRKFSKDREISGAAWLGARLLLLYLRLNIRSILKNCYPTKPNRADDSLIDEMLRASRDPGGLEVLESIFSFDLSLPLNYLLEGFEEKVLVIQGMKDPISDSKVKVAMLTEYCPGITIRQLDAGHCPHDERPEDVNPIISEWVGTAENKLHAGVSRSK